MADRIEFSKKTLSRDCACAQCWTPFDRGYAISSARASKPQYCTQQCRAESSRNRAKENFGPRFWSNVDVRGETECWPWTGRLDENGYGLFDYDGRPHIASRVSLMMKEGTLSPHLFACHTCDNPPCVNPAHLFAGTQKDNMQDASAKGKLAGGNGRRGSQVNTSKLDADKVKQIKNSSAPAKEFAERFGVSSTAISLIRSGKNWGWLDA